MAEGEGASVAEHDLNESDEGVMTLTEALEEFEELDKVSTAVLGASDPQNCSYAKGYLKRQALYACLTCNPKNAPFFQQGGVCLACSYKCHEGHEMVELYTKRNFRCDCGNKKFPDNPCTLQKEKEELNDKNTYSQNFAGLYCSCHRPYPDPDAEESVGPMIQCIICEDWYHTEHVIPGTGDLHSEAAEEQSVEMICGGCTAKLNFLPFYGKLQVTPKEAKSESENLDVVTIPIVNEESCKIECTASECDSASQDSGIASLQGTESTESEISQKPATKQDTCACPLQNDSSKVNFNGHGTLWAEGWRKQLCRCDTCKDVYESAGISYLLDEDDTIENYEAVGKAKIESAEAEAEESFTRQVNDLGHVGQIELISGYNNMKEALRTFLSGFAENGKVVGPKDVQDFFQNLKAAKRPRLHMDGTEF